MTDKTKISTGLTGDDAKLAALLQQARPTPDTAREAALLERIMAAAEKGPRLVVAGAEPARPVLKPVETAHGAPVTARPGVRRARTDIWAAGSLLAASLVLGVFLGQSTYTETTVRRIEQATGVMLASVSQDLVLSIAAAEDEDE